MKFVSTLEQRLPADLLVLPFWEGGKAAVDIGSLKKKIQTALVDFKGKSGETLLLYVEGEAEPRVLLLGLGVKSNSESLRRSYAAAVRAARAKKIKSVNFLFPKVAAESNHAVIEGILLTNYTFSELKGDSDKGALLEEIRFIGFNDIKLIERIETINAGVLWVRDLVNRNSDDKSPTAIAELIDGFKSKKLKVKVLGKAELEKEKMGLLLAVNRGSGREPRLVELTYRGDPTSKEHTVLIGKGVTYDTGGLSLKPTDGMIEMKSDMSGAATMLSVVKVASELGLKINVTALAPLAENSIDGDSFKLGDVYRSHSGKTVEIHNTDAEGRLLLADALSYALKHLKPTCMVDIASLTGSVIMALGNDISGLYTNDEKLSKALLDASANTDELLWRLPLYSDYKEPLKSEYADLLNIGGRDAASIRAALFLQEFAGDVSWAHIDFAGPCFLKSPKHYNTTSATGYGVRLLVEFLELRSK